MAVMKGGNWANHYQPQQQLKGFHFRMYNTPGCLGEWSESEYDLKQDVSKKGRLYVISASILASSEAFSQQRMSLTVYNSLPGSYIKIGTNYYEKSCLLGFWGSFYAMKTVNILVYPFIIS